MNFTHLAPVVRRLDNAIRRINLYPLDSVTRQFYSWALGVNIGTQTTRSFVHCFQVGLEFGIK